MPGGDRTGPVGMGPMTGRGAGFCGGYSTPGYANPVGGRRFLGRGRGFGMRGGGRGRGFGRGFGWARASYGWPARDQYAAPFASTMTAEQDLEGLKQQAEYFQDALDEVNKRIEQFEAENKK